MSLWLIRLGLLGLPLRADFTGCGWRAMCKRPRPEVVDEQVVATDQPKPRLMRLAAEDVRVEQAQVRPLMQGWAELVENGAADQQAKAAEPVHGDPRSFLLSP